MKYVAMTFKDIYELSDFLNNNNIRPEGIIGVYKDNRRHDLNGYDLLYVRSYDEEQTIDKGE